MIFPYCYKEELELGGNKYIQPPCRPTSNCNLMTESRNDKTAVVILKIVVVCHPTCACTVSMWPCLLTQSAAHRKYGCMQTLARVLSKEACRVLVTKLDVGS